jgi:hypothetical protein
MSLCPYVHIDTRQGIWTKRLKFQKVYNDKMFNIYETSKENNNTNKNHHNNREGQW